MRLNQNLIFQFQEDWIVCGYSTILYNLSSDYLRLKTAARKEIIYPMPLIVGSGGRIISKEVGKLFGKWIEDPVSVNQMPCL